MYQLNHMFVSPEGKAGELGADLMERNGGPMAQEAVARLGLGPTDRVIEIGFGPGLGLEAIAVAVPHGHVTGVDRSALMHRRAATRNATTIREGRMSLVVGTVASLPFVDVSFDAALAVDNLHFWSDRLGGLRELRRVLRPGSPFVCAFTPPSGGGKAGLADLFARAKYTAIIIADSSAGFTIRGITAD